MSNIDGLSKEHQQFYKFMKCPLCKQVPIVPTYFKLDGSKISTTTSYKKMDRQAVAKCPKCNGKWSVFSSSETGIGRQATGRITTVVADSFDQNQNYSHNNTIKILETGRIEEYFGSEQRLIDNSKSAISLKRKFMISKEWSQSYGIDYEKSSTKTGEIDLNIFITKVKLNFQKAITDKYSISENIKLAYSEEIELEVPEHTKLRVYFQWKRIWQQGLIQFSSQRNQNIEIPYQVVVGVTFDQTQIDEK